MIPPRRLAVRLAVVAVGLALAGSALTVPAQAAPRPAPAPSSATASATTTSLREAVRMAAVRTPRIRWQPCYQYAQCAEVKVPLDYDRPGGRQVTLALAKIPARNPARRIGSLFVNPGGPGASAVELALQIPVVASPELLDRFDIIGMDPRGTGYSEPVRCFTSPFSEEQAAGPLLTSSFPYGRAQTAAYLAAAATMAHGCSTTGRSLAASMSTAEVARDMELIRRAVGDQKLTYVGFSYGTYLGQVYANLFPDKVRAMVLDGVLDPEAWAGTGPDAASTPTGARLRSGDGAWTALAEILRRCDRVGGDRCAFAAGDPIAHLDLIMTRLKTHPVVEVDEETGETATIDYPFAVGLLLSLLDDPYGYAPIVEVLADLGRLTDPTPSPRAARPGVRATTSSRAALVRHLEQIERAEAARQSTTVTASPRHRPGFSFPYDNSYDAYLAIGCTDSANPADPASWPRAAARADRTARYFGAPWTWASVPCASSIWTARDEDAYRGPFTATTANPVLVVGSYWDPATSYRGAQKVARLLPNSRLLSSDNWGHTAYLTSDCVTSAIDRYLTGLVLPARGTVCTGDVQPFVDPGPQGLARTSHRLVAASALPR